MLAERRAARAAREVETIAVTVLRSRIADLSGDARTGALAAQVVGVSFRRMRRRTCCSTRLRRGRPGSRPAAEARFTVPVKDGLKRRPGWMLQVWAESSAAPERSA